MTIASSFSLRAPEPHERTALAVMWVYSWRATFDDIDFQARVPWLIAHLAKLESEGAKTICAFGEIANRDARESRLLGFVTIDPARLWLDQLSVHPHVFGAGVAQKLLGAAKRLSPQKIGLDVNADNFRARKFYEREGFATIGESVAPLSGRRTCVLEWRG